MWVSVGAQVLAGCDDELLGVLSGGVLLCVVASWVFPWSWFLGWHVDEESLLVIVLQ